MSSTIINVNSLILKPSVGGKFIFFLTYAEAIPHPCLFLLFFYLISQGNWSDQNFQRAKTYLQLQIYI